MQKKTRDRLGWIFATVLLIAIVYSLQNQLQELDWSSVYKELRETSWQVIGAGLLLTVMSYSIFATYDHLGLVNSDHPRYLRNYLAAFICYTFNFNLGSIIGGVGMRFKVYTDLGITKANVVKVITLSTISNWIGYCAIAGVFFLILPVQAPETYHLDRIPWRVLGIAGILLTVGYAVLALVGKDIKFRSWEVEWPSKNESLLRLGLGVLNWTTVASLLILLFSYQHGADPLVVAMAYFTAAVAGLVSHIPGGLGVFETVFLAFLAGSIGTANVVTGLLIFRVLYYFLPLCSALPILVFLRIGHESSTDASSIAEKQSA